MTDTEFSTDVVDDDFDDSDEEFEDFEDELEDDTLADEPTEDEVTSGTASPSRIGEFEIEFSDIPKIHRAPPPGRTAFPWETALQVVRDNRGKSARILTFKETGKSNPKARAQAKAQNIRNRLFEAVPDEHWEIKSRERDGVWGIYAIYHGKLTPEQQEIRNAKRQERADKIREGRENAKAENAEVEPEATE